MVPKDSVFFIDFSCPRALVLNVGGGGARGLADCQLLLWARWCSSLAATNCSLRVAARKSILQIGEAGAHRITGQCFGNKEGACSGNSRRRSHTTSMPSSSAQPPPWGSPFCSLCLPCDCSFYLLGVVPPAYLFRADWLCGSAAAG